MINFPFDSTFRRALCLQVEKILDSLVEFQVFML